MNDSSNNYRKGGGGIHNQQYGGGIRGGGQYTSNTSNRNVYRSSNNNRNNDRRPSGAGRPVLSLWKEQIPNSWNQIQNYVKDQQSYVTQQLPNPSESVALLAGVVTFGSTVALSTWTQGKIFHISTGTLGPLPSILGFTTVCLASVASHQLAISVYDYSQQHSYSLPPLPKWNGRQTNFIEFTSSLQTTIQQFSSDVQTFYHQEQQKRKRQRPYRKDDVIDMNGYFQIPLQTIRICCVGLLAFKLLGGRFWSIAPSSYTSIGSYGRYSASIPATEKYATTSQRTIIEKLGRQFGCHTCGTRMLFGTASNTVKFVSDHMPPKAVAEQMNEKLYRKILGLQVPYRFYPQCIHCSAKQGSILSQATQELRKYHQSSSLLKVFQQSNFKDLSQAGGGSNAYIHSLQPRIFHLTGAVVASIATYRTATVTGKRNQKQLTQEDIAKQRYDKLQKICTDCISKTYQVAQQVFPALPKPKSR